MNPQIDSIIDKAPKWREEMQQLRAIMLSCNLTEELKWGKPCYSADRKNIAIIQGFKEYCALLFFKGYLMKDPGNVLIKTGENTRVGRQLRVFSVDEVIKLEPIIKTYIQEAIELEKSGIKQPSPQKEELNLPQELLNKFNEVPNLKVAFEALTPGRQRAYNIYFSGAKQAQTREARIEKHVEQILHGKGLND